METGTLYQLLDGLPVAVLVIDAQGCPVYANVPAVKILGRGVDPDTRPHRLDEILPAYVAGTDKPYPREHAPILRALRGETTSADDVELRLPGGRATYLEVWGAPIRGEDGEILYGAAALVDITERRRVEDFVRLVETVTVAANQAGSIEEAFETCVDKVCAVTGWPVGHAYLVSDETGETVPTRMWHLSDPVRFASFRELTERTSVGPGDGLVGLVLASGLPLWIADVTTDAAFVRRDAAAEAGLRAAFAFPVLVQDEVTAVMEFFATTAEDPDEKLIHVMPHVGAQLGRVIERERSRAALERAYETEHRDVERLRALDETKNSFLHALSHDLRNPLAAISGFAELLQTKGRRLDSEEAVGIYEAIAINASRLDRMLRDLLDLDRLARGILEANRRPTDLANLVKEAIANVALHEHRVVVSIPETEALLDPAYVERIVENLLSNASKHTPPGTTIWVDATRDTEATIIGVSDEGPGIPDDMKASIFQVFKRGSTRAAGTGIGLSLVSRFSELHGGRAWVEDRPGGGACFRVLLRERPDEPRN